MAAKSAQPRMARNGGTFFTVKAASSASGSRFSAWTRGTGAGMLRHDRLAPPPETGRHHCPADPPPRMLAP
jgi:hypothetical protein